MEVSIFFVKFYGYLLFLVGIVSLISKDGRAVMLGALKNSDKVMFSGMMSLIIGLPTIILHNIWTADILGFITFLGWSTTVKGIVRIAYPSFVVKKMRNDTEKTLTISAIFSAILGAGLMYCGYFPYWS